MSFLYTSLFLIISQPFAQAAIKLTQMNIDPDAISVSGISSGAAMATQFHFAYSENVTACGLFAGVPYTCGFGGIPAATVCMSTPSIINLPYLYGLISGYDNSGQIDSRSNIIGDKVYIYHGQVDSTVLPDAGRKAAELYNNYDANVFTEFSINGQHGQPTHNYGAACASSSSSTEYINNCNYRGAHTMLNFFYDGLGQSDSYNPANLQEFDQSDFFSAHPSLSVMDTVGFIYIPENCKDLQTQCKLHIAFHGCSQSRSDVGRIFAEKSGYLETAEANNIIILFPQAIKNAVYSPYGCWDWYGYLNNFFRESIQCVTANNLEINKILKLLIFLAFLLWKNLNWN